MTDYYVCFRGHGEEELGEFIVFGCYPIKSFSPMDAAKMTISVALNQGYKRVCILYVFDNNFNDIKQEVWDWRNR